MQKFKQQLEI